MKKVLFLLMILSVFISCSDKGDKQNTADVVKEDTKQYKIGLVQYTSHPALDKAREGFKEAIKESGFNIEIDEKTANAEMSTATLISSNFASSNVDLIYSIATPAAQASTQATTTIPIIFSAVTDHKAAGLDVENVTGVSDAVDIKPQIELLIKINPDMKKIGVIYNTSEQNSKVQVDELKKVAAELGLEVVEKGIQQLSDIPVAAESLAKESDAIYLPTDNMVASSIPTIVDAANKYKKITFGAEGSHVENGALISQSIDYFDMGKEAGKLAIEILKNGKKPNELTVVTMKPEDIKINQATMDALGIKLPEDILTKAEIIKNK